MSNKKQTAVEWLTEKLRNEFGFAFSNNILEQAKELEKQQIIDFTNNFIAECTYGDYDGIVQRNKTVEQYHNEIFKNK